MLHEQRFYATFEIGAGKRMMHSLVLTRGESTKRKR